MLFSSLQPAHPSRHDTTAPTIQLNPDALIVLNIKSCIQQHNLDVTSDPADYSEFL